MSIHEQRQQTPACVSKRQHTPADVSIRQQTSAYVSKVSRHQHASAYASIRQRTSACVSIRQHTPADAVMNQRHAAIVLQDGACVSIREHTRAYEMRCGVEPAPCRDRAAQWAGSPSCQYLYFCTSKASTFVPVKQVLLY